MKPVIVIGAGGHAKVVISTLLAMGHAIVGATDRNSGRHGSNVLGVTVVGDDFVLKSYYPEDVVMAMGLGIPAVGSSVVVRAAIAAKLTAEGFEFPAILHPSAIIDREVKLGAGVQVMAGAIVQPGTEIGDFAIVNTGASVDHDCRIGAYAHVAPRACLAGGVSVGEGSLVGTGACVTPGVRIGAGCLVRAGSTVTRDLPDGARNNMRTDEDVA